MSESLPEQKRARVCELQKGTLTWDDVDESCCSICCQRFCSARQPYTVCGQGHTSCLECHAKLVEGGTKRPPRLAVCSMCKQPLHTKPIRNIPLESTLSILALPCPNGCDGGAPRRIDEFAEHEKRCARQQILCPMPSCNLFLRPNDAVQHCVSRHGCGGGGTPLPLAISTRGTIVECVGEGSIDVPAGFDVEPGTVFLFGPVHAELKPQAGRRIPCLAVACGRTARTAAGEVKVGVVDVTHGDTRAQPLSFRLRSVDLVLGKRLKACIVARAHSMVDVFSGQAGVAEAFCAGAFPVTTNQIANYLSTGGPASAEGLGSLHYQFTATLEKV